MLFHLYDGKELKCSSKKELPNVFYLLNTKTEIKTSWSGYKPEILKIEKVIKGGKISYCYDFTEYDGEDEYETNITFDIENYEREIFFINKKDCDKKTLKLIYEENKKYFFDRIVVEVKIHEYDNKIYTYYCEDLDIKVGAKVMNTTGAIGVVVKVKELYSSEFVEDIPYNFVLKRVWEISEKRYNFRLDELNDPYQFKPTSMIRHFNSEYGTLVNVTILEVQLQFLTRNEQEFTNTLRRLVEGYVSKNKEYKDISRYYNSTEMILDRVIPLNEFLVYSIERFYSIGKKTDIKILNITI